MFRKERASALLFGVLALIALTLLPADDGISGAVSKPPAKVKPAAAAPAFTGSFSKDADCALCHAPYAESMKNDRMLLGRHAAVTPKCSSCHKEADMATAHAKVTQAPGKFFKQRKYPNEMCQGCHGSYDRLAEKTKGSSAFKTTHNESINPHQPTHGQVECFNCHKMHKDKPPIEYCYGCHHPRQLSNCKYCHAPQKDS